MLFPVKIEFMEWPSGSWVDWSSLLNDAPVISKKVESENEGEAGLIVFDDCAVAFRNEGGLYTESSYEIYCDAVTGAVKYHFFLEKKSAYPYHLVNGMDYLSPDVTAWKIGESATPTFSTLLPDDGAEYTSGIVVETGVGVYSGMQVQIFNTENGTLVEAAYGDDSVLTAAQRYMYRISNIRKGLYAEPFEIVTHTGDQLVTEDGDILGSNYMGAQESKLFEGMADFGTLEWPEMGKLVSFNVLDKLSALDILQSKPVRTLYSFKDSTSNHLPWIVDLDYANGDYYTIYIGVNPSVIIEVIKHIHPTFTPEHIDVGSTVPVISAGMILVREESGGNKYLFAKSQYYYEGSYPGENDTWIEPAADSDSLTGSFRIDSSESEAYLVTDPTVKLKYYKDVFYNDDICNTSYALDPGDGIYKTNVTSFKGITCLTQLVAQAWGSFIPILKGITTYNIPYEYWLQTMDENPFGKTPLEALKMLANTMKVYVYFNKEGALVIHKRSEDTLGTSGTTRTIGNTKVIQAFKRKFFWDKIVDGVTMEVKSWLTDGLGQPLVGTSEVSKQIEAGVYIKPKNPITVEVLTNDAADNTQELLDARALTEATAYLDFYGKRRSSYEGVLVLDENTEAWELVDNIELNGVDYFFTSDDIDPVEKTVSLEAVEVVGHDYDRRQIVITPSGN